MDRVSLLMGLDQEIEPNTIIKGQHNNANSFEVEVIQPKGLVNHPVGSGLF